MARTLNPKPAKMNSQRDRFLDQREGYAFKRPLSRVVKDLGWKLQLVKCADMCRSTAIRKFTCLSAHNMYNSVQRQVM